jgi:glycosyltransferase involved in cell wall biosynthesis
MNKQQRVAYFVSVYPARSHTFIRREIDSLTALGLKIHRFSLRRMCHKELMDETDFHEFEQTTAIFPISVVAFLQGAFHFFSQHPLRVMDALRFSLRIRPPGCVGFLKSFQYAVGGIVLAQLLRRLTINLIHVHFANSGACIGSIAAKLLGVKWGISLHGLSDFSSPSVQILPELIQNASFVRCISRFARSQAMLHSPRDCWSKIFVAYAGIPDPHFHGETHNSRGHSNPELTLVTVGRLAPEKAHSLLLKACSRLVADGLNFKCLIVGDGPIRSEIEKDISQYQLEDVCILVGAVPEAAVSSYLVQADVFVLTSLMEGIPQVLMEAMQSGVPVVAPMISGIPELVTDGIDGMLFMPADEDSLVLSLTKLARDRELRQHIGKAGELKIKSMFRNSLTITPLANVLTRKN